MSYEALIWELDELSSLANTQERDHDPTLVDTLERMEQLEYTLELLEEAEGLSQ
jgi:hypothetical protein